MNLQTKKSYKANHNGQGAYPSEKSTRHLTKNREKARAQKSQGVIPAKGLKNLKGKRPKRLKGKG
jgi:hypothetical protein